MTPEEALRKWGYKATMLQRLVAVCSTCPSLFVKDERIVIPDNSKPLYIPVKTFRVQGAIYAHLLKACIERKLVIPESLGLSCAEMEQYLGQLAIHGLITFCDETAESTLQYVPTPAGEAWPSWKNKVKRLFQILEPLVPNITITTG